MPEYCGIIFPLDTLEGRGEIVGYIEILIYQSINKIFQSKLVCNQHVCNKSLLFYWCVHAITHIGRLKNFT